MNTGQMSMMPANAGGPMLANAQPSSPITALSGPGEQAGSPFIGLLEGMAPPKTSQGVAVLGSDGKDVSASGNNSENVSTTAVQDNAAGLMAGLLNALGSTVKPLATGAEESSAEVRTATNSPGKKPQNVVLNADGLQMALLIQANSGRMLQDDGTVGQQAFLVTGKPLTSATEGSAEVPASADSSDKKPQDVVLNAVGMQPSPLLIQVTSDKMPQADGAIAQQAVTASEPNAVIASLSNNGSAVGIAAATGVDADGGLNPSESMLNHSRSAMVKDIPLKGSSTDSSALGVVSEKQERTALPALSSQQVSTIAAQKNTAVVDDIVSTERGKVPSDQNGSVNGTSAPVSGATSLGKGTAEINTNAPSGVEVTAQPQQEVTVFRSASLEVALAESVPQNEVRTTGQALNRTSAQNTPVTEVPATPTGKLTQTEVQQDIRPAKTGVMPAQVTLSPASSQQPDQAVTTNNRTLEGTRSAQAAVVPAAGKIGVEAGGEAVQPRPESAVATKPVQSIAVEAVKLAGAGSSGEEFGTGDDKGAADNFMNGQFHATLMHQPGNTDGASAASNVTVPVQNDVPRSGLSDQILQQVKDRLENHEVKAGNDQIVLRLSPENLGDLKMNLSMDGQRLRVEIVAENHMVRDALLQNTDSLKESLARQNISMESFNVTTNGRGAGNPGQGQQQNDWREFAQQKQQSAWMSSGGYRLPDVPAVPSQMAYQTPSQHAMVDLHF